jgi:hypothetical protein
MSLALALWMMVVAAYTAILFKLTRTGWGRGNEEVAKDTPPPHVQARVVPLRRPEPASPPGSDRRRPNGIRLAH